MLLHTISTMLNSFAFRAFVLDLLFKSICCLKTPHLFFSPVLGIKRAKFTIIRDYHKWGEDAAKLALDLISQKENILG